MSQATLRKLAREYADGSLAKEDYRKSRAELLEGILSGKIELKVNEYLPPVVSKDDDVLDITTDKPPKKENSDITQFGTADSSAASAPATQAPASPEPQASPSNDKQKLIMIGGAAGLVLIIAVIVVLLPESKDTSANKNTTKKLVSTEQSVPVNTSPGKAQNLIQEFLEKKDWSETSMNRFRIQWQSLTTEQQAAAKGTVQLGQLTNSIYKKLLEERALSGLGDDEEVLNKQRKLVQFAESLGIKDSRISLPKGATL